MFSRSYSLALGLALLTAMPAVTPAREVRVADTQPADYPTVQALQYMAQIIEERSAGRHRLHVFHSRQLGEEKETIEQTRIGAIDLNRTNVAPIGGLIPLAPYIALSRPHVAFVWSVVATLLALAVFGYIKGSFTGTAPGRSAIRTAVIGGLAAAAAYLIAKAVS